MPEFNKVYEEYGTAVAFMMVDLVDGNRETREKGLEFITSRGYRFPCISICIRKLPKPTALHPSP